MHNIFSFIKWSLRKLIYGTVALFTHWWRFASGSLYGIFYHFIIVLTITWTSALLFLHGGIAAAARLTLIVILVLVLPPAIRLAYKAFDKERNKLFDHLKD